MIRFIELFAGIGGFRYGLETIRPIQSSNTTRSKECQQFENELVQRKHLDYTCVWANEIDKYACQIYRKNFGKGELYEGDIRTVRPEDIPEAELLIGGFPCQAFSIAGKRRGFEDTRGTLFYEIARIARANRYKTLLLENVKGLLNHENGSTFEVILRVLEELGYDVEWQVLNSKNFGVPQNRERVFIVGHLRGESRRQVFSVGEGFNFSQETNKNKQRKKKLASTVRPGLSGLPGNSETYIKVHNMLPRSGNPKQGGTGHLSKDNGSAYCLDSGRTNAIEFNDMKIRRLTPVECERLQGFPDGWTEGISDIQRYKCLGNAVTTNVITEIGKKLF